MKLTDRVLDVDDRRLDGTVHGYRRRSGVCVSPGDAWQYSAVPGEPISLGSSMRLYTIVGAFICVPARTDHSHRSTRYRRSGVYRMTVTFATRLRHCNDWSRYTPGTTHTHTQWELIEREFIRIPHKIHCLHSLNDTHTNTHIGCQIMQRVINLLKQLLVETFEIAALISFYERGWGAENAELEWKKWPNSNATGASVKPPGPVVLPAVLFRPSFSSHAFFIASFKVGICQLLVRYRLSKLINSCLYGS